MAGPPATPVKSFKPPRATRKAWARRHIDLDLARRGHTAGKPGRIATDKDDTWKVDLAADYREAPPAGAAMVSGLNENAPVSIEGRGNRRRSRSNACDDRQSDCAQITFVQLVLSKSR